MHEGFVGGDAENPGFELGGLTLEGFEMAENLYQRLLKHIFGIVMCDDCAAYVPVKAVSVFCREQSESLFLLSFLAEHGEYGFVAVVWGHRLLGLLVIDML